MKASTVQPWMQLPLSSTHLSKLFRDTATHNGFNTIGQLLSIKLTNVLQMDWFTPAMMDEIASIVKKLKREK
ncbi:MAG: hypothetical protein JWQ30_1095 [Sediminibacterium sp.]|nr:hypothetical protein [Sediminibacterium sp.]